MKLQHQEGDGSKKAVHEMRESYDVSDVGAMFPDDRVPELRTSVTQLTDALGTLAYRVFR